VEEHREIATFGEVGGHHVGWSHGREERRGKERGGLLEGWSEMITIQIKQTNNTNKQTKE
jgi:hypothetical protein